MADLLRVAVVGCGWAGQVHAEAYTRHPRVRLVGVCDPLIERAEELASRTNCTPYSSIEALLEHEKIDAVSIASPSETHVALAEICLAAEVAVLCEKPLSRDWISAQHLVHTARSSGRLLGVNYNRRFAAGYRLASVRLKNSGDVRFISSILAQNVPLAATPEMRAKLSQDFLVFDACSHLLDLTCFLVGQEPQSIYAFGTREAPGQLWTDIQIGLHFEQGAVGSLLVSLAGPEWGQLPIERTEIGTQSERIIVDNISQSVEWFGYRDAESHVWRPGVFEPVGYGDSMIASIHAWVEAVMQNSLPPVTGEQGARVVGLCEQVINSLNAQEKGMQA
ncbi:MAG: Gfo/Idh/MocA family oxidoreductase [Chloroflexi bacterium]|nr:Gfo/Idh/MocA family oxidoreductase [Chloroflexota bacterium]